MAPVLNVSPKSTRPAGRYHPPAHQDKKEDFSCIPSLSNIFFLCSTVFMDRHEFSFAPHHAQRKQRAGHREVLQLRCRRRIVSKNSNNEKNETGGPMQQGRYERELTVALAAVRQACVATMAALASLSDAADTITKDDESPVTIGDFSSQDCLFMVNFGISIIGTDSKK
jgi:hypothetical protein